MSSFPGSPKLLRGGIVLLDPVTSAVQRVIVLQYNPDTMSRTFTVQAAAAEGDRLEALRLKGPPNEQIKVDAEVDAADQMESPGSHADTLRYGVYPQLSALETILYPPSSQLQNAANLAGTGVLEILPATMPLTLFIWSRSRVMPVRLTEMSVTEEAFDPSLNPLRAKVTLGMRVLTVNDLEYGSKGSSLFLVYQRQKERLAAKLASRDLSPFGITGLS